jgi:hypothetical protein
VDRTRWRNMLALLMSTVSHAPVHTTFSIWSLASLRASFSFCWTRISWSCLRKFLIVLFNLITILLRSSAIWVTWRWTKTLKYSLRLNQWMQLWHSHLLNLKIYYPSTPWFLRMCARWSRLLKSGVEWVKSISLICPILSSRIENEQVFFYII